MTKIHGCKRYNFDYEFDKPKHLRHNFERQLDSFGIVMSKKLLVRKEDGKEELVYHYKVDVPNKDVPWFEALMFN